MQQNRLYRLFSLLLFPLFFTTVCGARELKLSETGKVVGLTDYAVLFSTSPQESLANVADSLLQPLSNEKKALLEEKWFRINPEQSDWFFLTITNDEFKSRRLFFYLGSNMDVTVFRYSYQTGRRDSLILDGFFRREGSFIFPLDFPEESKYNLCFRVGKGNRPSHFKLHDIACNDREAIREKLFSNLISTDIPRIFQISIELLFMGMIIGIMFFASFHYLQTRDVVFIFYFLYLFFILLFMFNRMAEVASSEVIWYYMGYFRDLTWQPLSYLFYFLFSMHFVDFRKYNPTILRILKIMAGLILLYVVIDMFLAYREQLSLRNQLYSGFRLALIPVALYLIVNTFLIRDRFARILASGSLFMAGGAIIAFCLYLFSKSDDIWWFHYQMQIMYTGIVIELLFFTSGLSLKTKAVANEKALLTVQLDREREMKELEKKQTAIEVQQQERERFAQDLHDDLGSGLTSIRFLSEAIRKNPGDNASIEKISNLAEEMNRNMRQIVWAMQSGNRSLVDLSRFIKSQVNDLLEIKGIGFSCKIEDTLPDIPLTGYQVRSIGLTVKETVNNILKHSKAGKVEMNIFHDNGLATMSINDDGIGIEFNGESFLKGGLSNMKQRMYSIAGDIKWVTSSKGTQVIISFPVRKYLPDGQIGSQTEN